MWAPKHALGARVEMALGVARGMAAMEAARPPLLHRDLKPTNVFIGKRRRF
jgi:serine/threonine protein kinase